MLKAFKKNDKNAISIPDAIIIIAITYDILSLMLNSFHR